MALCDVPNMYRKCNKSVHLPTWLSFLCLLGDLAVIWSGRELLVQAQCSLTFAKNLARNHLQRNRQSTRKGEFILHHSDIGTEIILAVSNILGKSLQNVGKNFRKHNQEKETSWRVATWHAITHFVCFVNLSENVWYTRTISVPLSEHDRS